LIDFSLTLGERDVFDLLRKEIIGVVIVVAVGLLESSALAAQVEYAQDLKDLHELARSSEVPPDGAVEDRAVMKSVDSLAAQPEELGSESASKSVSEGASNDELSRFVAGPVNSAQMTATVFSAGEETSLFLRQGENVVVVFSVSSDLASRVANGAVTSEDAALILSELAEKQGTDYWIPRDSRDLKVALGLSPDAVTSVEDLHELLAVHVQISLGVSVKAATHLAELLWYLTASRN
jgi:hypothetical protein